MAALANAKWMIVSSAIYRMIEDKGWSNIGMEQRPMLLGGLSHDINAAHEMYEKADDRIRQEVWPEMEEAKGALRTLVETR